MPFCWQAPFVGLPLGDGWCGIPARRAGVLFPLPLYFDVALYGGEPYEVSREVTAPHAKIIDAAALGPRGELDIQRVTDRVVRLTRRDDGRSVLEVVLFVADSVSRVIASQTVSEPPFTALFDVTPRVASVGLSVVYADGVRTTLTVPYGERK